MPLPSPNKGETKKEFIARCIVEITENESERFPARAQRVAVCYSQWGETPEERQQYEKEKQKKHLH